MDSNQDLVKTVINKMQEKKARDIISLDVSEVSDVTESFIICTAQTNIHSKVLTDSIVEATENKGMSAHHIEGYELGRWILIDYLDLVVHIFLEKQRSYYGLERLWGDVPCTEYNNEE